MVVQLTPFPFDMTPMANISAPTYRDGTTYTRGLEQLKNWLNDVLVPDTNNMVADAFAQFEAGLANAELTVTGAKDGWQAAFDVFIADVTAQLAALNDQAVTDLVLNELSIFGAATRDLIDTHGSSIFVRQDTLAVLGGALFVKKGDLTVNVKDHGVVGDGATDDTAALQVAADYAYTLSPDAVLFMPPGTYATTGTVQVRSSLHAAAATINYTGAGVALILGTTVAGSAGVTQRKTFNCPRVIHASTTKWDGTSVGIRGNSLNSCLITVPFVMDFEKGFECVGLGQGFVHNTVHIQSLWANHKNLVLNMDDTGWCNSNTFVGGRLSAGGSVVDDVEHAHIYAVRPASSAIGNPNANTFVGMSLEAGSNMYYRAVIAGNANAFLNCRWEALGGSIPRVLWKSTASWNRIDGGYDAFKIVEIYEGTAAGGPSIIQDGGNTRGRGLNISGQAIPPTVATTLKGWSSLSLNKITYDTATGEFTPKWGRWRIEGKVAFNSAASGYVQVTLMCGTSVIDIVRLPASSSQLTTVKFGGTYNFNGAEKFYIQCQHSGTVDNVLPASVNLTSIEAVYEPA